MNLNITWQKIFCRYKSLKKCQVLECSMDISFPHIECSCYPEQKKATEAVQGLQTQRK